MGMDVAVERSTGAVRVLRVACAHDCGLMINPDAVRAQVEDRILQTQSRTLFEEVTFDRSRGTSTDWASYPILTFPDVPRLEIVLIDRRDEPYKQRRSAALAEWRALAASIVARERACRATRRRSPVTLTTPAHGPLANVRTPVGPTSAAEQLLRLARSSPNSMSARMTGSCSGGRPSARRLSSAVGPSAPAIDAVPRSTSAPSRLTIRISVSRAPAGGLAMTACTSSPSKAGLR